MEMILMKNKRYNNYFTVILYLILLRVVLSFTVGINFFSLGLIFDIFLIMFWIGAVAILMKKAITQKIFYSIVVFVASIFAIGDSIHFDYFETIISRKSFEGITQLQQGTTLEYDIAIPAVVYVVMPLLIGVLYLIISNKKRDVFELKHFIILSSVFVVQVGLFVVWSSLSYDTKLEYYKSDGYLFESMHDRELYSQKYGYYNYHALDFTKIRPKLDVDEVKPELDAYFANKEQHLTNDMSDTYNGYNLVTILAESLDTRFINETLSPNLYMMLENGMSFENYYTPVFQQGATCNSEFMSLNGLTAITTNDWSNNICDEYSDNYFPYSLPAQLTNQGYDTYYFHSGHNWFYNREKIIPAYRFETVKFQEDLQEIGYEDYTERLDTDMIAFFEEYMTYDNQFFVNVLTYSMHGAYNQEVFNKYSDIVEAAYPNNDFDPDIINYMEKLIEFDNLIGLIMDELEEQGVLDNTLFAVFPDHYPYMMDDEIYNPYIEMDKYDHEVMRQELLIYATGMTKVRIETPGSTMDITPTLLNLINSDSNFDYFMGDDLLGTDENYIMFSDLTVTDGVNYLYISEEMMGNAEHFNILDSALEDEITSFELLKQLLQIDYFQLLEDE